MAAASPFSGSMGLGYVNSWGKNDSKILDRSEMNKRYKSHGLCISIYKKSLKTVRSDCKENPKT